MMMTASRYEIDEASELRRLLKESERQLTEARQECRRAKWWAQAWKQAAKMSIVVRYFRANRRLRRVGRMD
jgi:hypothetical protein